MQPAQAADITKHYPWDKHCLYQSSSFEACANWHQSRHCHEEAERTADGYGLELGFLDAAMVRHKMSLGTVSCASFGRGSA